MSTTYENPYAPPSTVREPAAEAPHVARTLPIGAVLRRSWSAYTKQKYFLTGALVVQEAIAAGSGYGFGLLATSAPKTADGIPPWSALVGTQLGVFVVGIFLGTGSIRLALSCARRGDARLSELFSGLDVLWPQLLATLVTVLLCLAGGVALILPGLAVAMATSLVPYLIADRRISAMQAIRASFVLTRGVRLRIFALMLIAFAILLLGIAALGVGLLVALPFVSVIGAETYRQLIGEGE